MIYISRDVSSRYILYIEMRYLLQLLNIDSVGEVVREYLKKYDRPVTYCYYFT